MRTITAQDLRQMLDTRSDLLVLNVLEAGKFERVHIPGSHNLPVGSDNFAKQALDLAGRKDRTIVVHCSDSSCTASNKAVNMLTEAGFTDLIHFPGGMPEWKQAGFETASGALASR